MAWFLLTSPSSSSPISPISLPSVLYLPNFSYFCALQREHVIVIFTSGCLKSCCSRLHYIITYCKMARLGFSYFSQFLLPNFSYFSPKYTVSPFISPSLLHIFPPTPLLQQQQQQR